MFNKTMGVRGIASAANLQSVVGRYSFWYPQVLCAKYDEPPAAEPEPGVEPSEGVPPEGTPAAEENQENEGLKAGIVAEREKRQAAEAELQNERDRNALLSAPQPQAQPQAEQTTLYKAVATQLGIDPEYASQEEQGQIFEGMMQIRTSQQSEQSFINSHPDYSEVVGVQGPGGPNDFRPAPPLMRAIKANPAVANALRNSPNKAVLAYAIASTDPQYLAEVAERNKPTDVKQAEKAAAKIEAANQQLSVSATTTGKGTLDNAARRAAQTDEEFLAENERIMEQAN